jgi:hypothetical protein
MRTLFVGLFFFTAILADAQVVVTSVFNVGDTSENLCPGLEVAIIGSNLGAFGPRAPSQSVANRRRLFRTDQAPSSPCSPPIFPSDPPP